MAAAGNAEKGFLEGARALYYEELTAVISYAVARGIQMILPGGDT